MVYPISGPTYKLTQRFGSPNSQGSIPTIYERVQYKYKQPRPFNLVLPYNVQVDSVLTFAGNNPLDYASIPVSASPYPELKTWAQSRAYERFKDSVGESADLGITLAEWKSSLSMIYTRAKHVVDVLGAARRGNFGKAAKGLFEGFTGDSRQYKGAKSAQDYGRRFKKGTEKVSDFWLETWFGWLPTISDIGSAVDTIQSPLPYNLYAKGTATVTRSVSYVPPPNFYASWDDTWVIRSGTYWTHVAKHKYFARIRVENPNLYLANQLGLVNPAVVAWELVPFSFVADWFANVSQFLSACTDFLGLELYDSYENTKYEIRESHFYSDNWRYWSTDPGYWTSYNRTRAWSKLQTQFTRSPGVTTPSLHWKEFKLPWQRTATICALASQLMR